MIKEKDKGKRETETHTKNKMHHVINVIIELYKEI